MIVVEHSSRTFADSLPALCWVANPDGYIVWYNRSWYETTGTTPEQMEGWGWQSVHDPKELPQVLERWQRSIETGEPFEMVFPLQKADGTFAPFLTRVKPSRDLSGKITGWFGVNTDISEQVKAEQARVVLSNELSHRIKNIFSVVTALVSISAKSFPAAKTFAADLKHRITALASAHDYIRPHERSVPSTSPATLLVLTKQLLAPYQNVERVRIIGDDLPLTDKALMSVALLIHELATNSTKYGSLSIPTGRVEVISELSDHALRLNWVELDGPPVEAPISMGFGSSLTRISVEAQLGGRITYDWQPTGLIVCSTIPRRALSED